METILLFHILLSGEYFTWLNQLNFSQQLSDCFIFHFKVSGPCCEAPLMPVLAEASSFFALLFSPDILFLSAQLVNMMSNLPRTTSNSNDVGRNTDALTTLLICFPGSKTPPLLMENLTCSICVFIHVQLIFWALSDIYPVRWRTAKVTEIAPWSNCTALW